MSHYQTRIAELAPQVDPRHVEAWMREEHPTLDHLSPAAFQREVAVAVELIAIVGTQQSESLAQSRGL